MHRAALLHERHDVAHDVSPVVGEVLHLGLGARVHEDQPGTVRGARVGQGRVAQSAHVVDEMRTGVEPRVRDRWLPRVDRDGHAKWFGDGCDPSGEFRGVDAGLRAFTGEVDLDEPASTEIRGRSGFDVRATEPCAYLCEFL